MLTLHDLQSVFSRSMAGEPPAELLRHIAGDGFDPAARLGIYRNNVMTRLTDTLSSTYPVVSQLVDPRFFAYSAGEFIRQHLPSSGCLSEYGANFPAFLTGFTPAAGLKYLADVARLEWAIHQISHTHALPAVSIHELAALGGDPARFRLRITTAVRFLVSPFPIDQIWIAHQGDTSSEGIQLKGGEVWLQIGGTEALRINHLAPATWEFRARLAEGASLGTAAGAALEVSAGFDPTSALAAIFADKLVIGLDQGDDT